MQMRQRDEEKRSKEWKIVMLVSTLVILLVTGLLIVRSVLMNPLEGEWVEVDKGYHLDVDDDEITVEAVINGEHVEVDLHYTLDKTNKIITLKSRAIDYAEAADDTDGKLSPSEISDAMTDFVSSYDYSIEGGKLTLTEQEFGTNQFVFTRIEK